MPRQSRIKESSFYKCRLRDWLDSSGLTAYEVSQVTSMRSEIYRLAAPTQPDYPRDFAGQYNLDLLCAYFPEAGEVIFDYDGEFIPPQLSSLESIRDWDGSAWDGAFHTHPLIRELRGEVARNSRHGLKPVFDLSKATYYRSPFFRNNIGLLCCHLPDEDRMFARKEGSNEFNSRRCDREKMLSGEYNGDYEEIIWPQPFTRPYQIAKKSGTAPPTLTHSVRDPRYIPSIAILDKINAVLPHGSLVSFDPIPEFRVGDTELTQEDREERVDKFLRWVGKEPF